MIEVGIEMIAWLTLFVLLAVQIGGLIWWLRREYLPFIFNGKAPLIYSFVLAVDCVVTWLVSMSESPGGSSGAAMLAVLGIIQLVIAVVLALFFLWVVKSDLTDIK